MNNNSGKSAFAAVALVGKKKSQSNNDGQTPTNTPKAQKEIMDQITHPKNALIQENTALANEMNNHGVTAEVANANAHNAIAENTVEVAETVQKSSNDAVSDLLANAGKAAKSIKQIQEDTNKAISTMFQKTSLEAEGYALVNPFEFMSASIGRFQNRISEINENIQETREANRENVVQMVEVAREAMDDISAACIEATQKSVTTGCPMTNLTAQIECAQKIQSAYSALVENASKTSYDTWRNYMSMWFCVK